MKDLDYDQYRSIRFLPERALWRGKNLPFEAQFFHRGFFYKNRVNIFEVADGKAIELKYRKADFSFGDKVLPFEDSDLGFAGFRIHAPMNRPDYYDEVCVFLGASYFRAVPRGRRTGSARGLSIDTGEAKGEEFPLFKAFWLERPAPGATSLVIHALLDSKSCAASYRFTVRPGDTTVFDVEMSVYPRVDVPRAGLAPMTSMFFFGPNDRNVVDDFRPSVHDSDGLAIFNGKGESLWRPLSNPRDLQISTFQDLNPRGFGLMQRERNFFAYQDIESSFEKRPSLWVEPIGDWGEGGVMLFEIPSKEEVHDNIAAFWRPKTPLQAKGEHNYTYRLHWGPDSPKPHSLARFKRSGIGARGEDARLFVLDLVGENLKGIDPAGVKGVVTAEKSEVKNIVTQPNPYNRRLAAELPMPGERRADRAAGASYRGRQALVGSLGLPMGSLNTAPQPVAGDIATQRLLPRETPLPMAPSDLAKNRAPDRVPAAVAPAMAWRRGVILLSTVALTGAGGYEMYREFEVGGVTVLEAMVLALFLVLLAWVAFSFASALAGFFVLLVHRPDAVDAELPIASRTVMLLPTYNEDPHRLAARLRAIIKSLETTSHGKLFDWFVLSDSTDPDIWVAEEKALLALRQAVGIPRLYYRHRADNTARKAGNISEWMGQRPSCHVPFICVVRRLMSHVPSPPFASTGQPTPSSLTQMRIRCSFEKGIFEAVGHKLVHFGATLMFLSIRGAVFCRPLSLAPGKVHRCKRSLRALVALGNCRRRSARMAIRGA